MCQTFKSGKIKSISYYKDGKEVGEWFTYDESGNVVKKMQY